MIITLSLCTCKATRVIVITINQVINKRKVIQSTLNWHIILFVKQFNNCIIFLSPTLFGKSNERWTATQSSNDRYITKQYAGEVQLLATGLVVIWQRRPMISWQP